MTAQNVTVLKGGQGQLPLPPPPTRLEARCMYSFKVFMMHKRDKRPEDLFILKHTRTRTQARARAHTHKYTHAHAQTPHVHTHARTHTHTHTRAHTQKKCQEDGRRFIFRADLKADVELE